MLLHIAQGQIISTGTKLFLVRHLHLLNLKLLASEGGEHLWKNLYGIGEHSIFDKFLGLFLIFGIASHHFLLHIHFWNFLLIFTVFFYDIDFLESSVSASFGHFCSSFLQICVDFGILRIFLHNGLEILECQLVVIHFHVGFASSVVSLDIIFLKELLESKLRTELQSATHFS